MVGAQGAPQLARRRSLATNVIDADSHERIHPRVTTAPNESNEALASHADSHKIDR